MALQLLIRFARVGFLGPGLKDFEVRNVSLLVGGFREILSICEGAKEGKSGWSAFLRIWSPERPFSDVCRGLVESVADFPPEARDQRCMVHFTTTFSVTIVD